MRTLFLSFLCYPLGLPFGPRGFLFSGICNCKALLFFFQKNLHLLKYLMQTQSFLFIDQGLPEEMAYLRFFRDYKCLGSMGHQKIIIIACREADTFFEAAFFYLYCSRGCFI
jgi:hypothetical protein